MTLACQLVLELMGQFLNEYTLAINPVAPALTVRLRLKMAYYFKVHIYIVGSIISGTSFEIPGDRRAWL